MWKRLANWFSPIVDSVKNYLQAHPKVKNWLDGLEKVVIASVLSYLALVVKIVTDSLMAGTPIHQDFHLLAVAFFSGLFIAVSGPVKAYCQNLHDVILANNQDNSMASSLDVPLTTSSVLTPVANPTTTIQGGVDVKKITGLVLGLLLLSSSAMAWDMKGDSFRLATKANAVGISVADIPVNGEDVFAAVPLIDGQYSFSTPIAAGSWDLGFSEAIGVYNLKPGVGNSVSVQSLCFLGVGLRTNVSSELATPQFSVPLVVSWGAELGSPTILGVSALTLGIEGTFQSPAVKLTVGTVAPIENVVDFAIHVFSIFK